MEQVFRIVGDSMEKVNDALGRGGKVKMMHAVYGEYAGTSYCYIVVEMPDPVGNERSQR